ncbi:ead/Ea22-like family protein [Enterobacter hormaechei]|uniref:ead/Ea22-like family protein n=1 Tax=Enterobacter hormaechei TaxID=158836 RepID=UPI003A96E502
MSNIDKQALRSTSDRDWFEDWFKREFHPDKTGPYIKDQLFFAVRAARAPLLDELEAAEKRISELESDNAYIKNRHKELDLLIGKNILVMQAAIIEWQGTGDAKKGLAWIYNTLFGPGELPDESEKDAQAYFDRKYAPLDEELMNLHRWFWEQSEAERAATAGKGEAS